MSWDDDLVVGEDEKRGRKKHTNCQKEDTSSFIYSRDK